MTLPYNFSMKKLSLSSSSSKVLDVPIGTTKMVPIPCYEAPTCSVWRTRRNRVLPSPPTSNTGDLYYAIIDEYMKEALRDWRCILQHLGKKTPPYYNSSQNILTAYYIVIRANLVLLDHGHPVWITCS